MAKIVATVETTGTIYNYWGGVDLRSGGVVVDEKKKKKDGKIGIAKEKAKNGI